ncbi:MAG: UdgX family uracil-DNA binding protein [Woeseia sp.]|nr:UdgX family uracil-DNA binding protein [Woeseia sp.]
MVSITLDHAANYDEWRAVARRLLAAGVAPERTGFRHASSSADLFDGGAAILTPSGNTDRNIRVPRAFVGLARDVLCHRDGSRFALLYRLLWRLSENRRLLENRADADVYAARRLAKAVRRESHKMKAFVRFRRVESESGEAFVAWFEPEHHIVERTAPFFTRRFSGMRWSIVTPERSAHWDGRSLTFGDGATRNDCPDDDALENHWRVYYASIFNPARLKLNAMRAEMPVKFWRNLPESRLIPELSRSARREQYASRSGTAPSAATARRLVASQPGMAMPEVTSVNTLDDIASALQQCSRCQLCKSATAAVPGEGPAHAKLLIVGEQPGDEEDLSGRPFVGPAGKVLDAALEEAGIDRKSVFLTNTVKHFKFKPRGKRRIHQRPNVSEIESCRWWLDLERDIVSAPVTLALGATAARAVLGRPVKVSDIRGRAIANDNGGVSLVTIHPAFLLRLPNQAEARRQRTQFVNDLRMARTRSEQSASLL